MGDARGCKLAGDGETLSFVESLVFANGFWILPTMAGAAAAGILTPIHVRKRLPTRRVQSRTYSFHFAPNDNRKYSYLRYS